MDIQAVAVRPLKRACQMFLQDLEAIPDSAYDQKFGPSCRTIADIVYEVNLVNDHIGLTIRQEPLFPWPEEKLIKAPDDFRGKEEIVQAFRESSDRIVATAESFSAEALEASIPNDDGETTRFERCRFMALHLWYHMGQLNFIQTLLGDEEIHWH